MFGLVFLSRLFGGEGVAGEKLDLFDFLSRLFGGEVQSLSKSQSAQFLSRLFGGEDSSTMVKSSRTISKPPVRR